MRRGLRRLVALLVLSPCAVGLAQEGPLKVEPLSDAPPAELASAVRGALGKTGLRVRDGQGRPFAELWLRQAIPATGKPSGPKGAVLYPVLGEGELLGAIKLIEEGHDYRDQAIAPGLYTLRYGLQPVNGDHLGVSTYRDYLLLLPAEKDEELKPPARKALEARSAEAAGSNHPGVLILIAPPAGAASPGVAQDAEKNLWGLILTLPLAVPGQAESTPLPVQLILVGAAPV